MAFPLSLTLGAVGSAIAIPIGLLFGLPYFVYKQIKDKSKMKQQSKETVEKRYQEARETQGEIEKIKNKHGENMI